MLKKGVGTLLPYKVILERKLLLSSFFPLLPFLLLLLNPGLGGEATDKDCLALGVTSLKIVVTLPLLCVSVREQSIPCFTLSSQHEMIKGSTETRVSSWKSAAAIFFVKVRLK